MNKSKKILAVLLALILALSVAAVGTGSLTVGAAEDNGEAAGITPYQTIKDTIDYTMVVGQTHTFKCYTSYKTIKFFNVLNTNKSVASAKGNGRDSAFVRALKPGRTKITINVNTEYETISAYDYKIHCLEINLTVKASSAPAPSTAAPKNVRIRNYCDGFNVNWNKVSGAIGYRVFYKRSTDSEWRNTETDKNYANILDLWSGALYYVQVQSINADGKYCGISKAISMTQVRGTTLKSVVYNSNGTVTLKWLNAPGANGYAIAKRVAGSSQYSYTYINRGYQDTIISPDKQYTDKKAAAGKVYCYQIRPYYSNGKSAAYAEWSNSKSTTTLYKPTITNMNINASRLNINWNKIKGASKFKVAFKRASDKAWNYRTVTKNYYNVANPTPGAKYYVQVSAMNGNAASPYSAVKTITLVRPAQPVITNINYNASQLNINWNAVSSATGYTVAFKRSYDKAWNYRTTKSKYFNVPNPTKGATYYVQVCAINNGVSSPYSSVKSYKIPAA